MTEENTNEEKIPKELASKIGRSFALLYNRLSMYNLDHPFAAQALDDFFDIVDEGLSYSSPIVVIMYKDQFFVEEEPLDPRINTSKMLAHFKKTGIQSISFEQEVAEKELNNFAGIFINTAEHPTAEAMKEACAEENIVRIKINHVFYRKVTEDDEVIDRKTLEQQSGKAGDGSGEADGSSALEMMAESVLMEELEKSLSLGNVLENPQAASQQMLAAEAAAAKEGSAPSGSGSVIMQNLQQIRNEVDAAAEGDQQMNMQQLAQAVFDMKRNLLKGIEAQKASGVVFQNEAQIIAEADELTDNVLLQLIRDEYQQGKISVQRLAHIVRRLIPQPKEIQRLLPKIKEVLLEEGMALNQFLQLTQELKKELQSEGLAHVLEKGAEEIGISGEDLVREISQDPKGAAELIYLASEIRKGTGDDTVLQDLLVDYVERVGSHLALDAADKQGVQGGKQLRSIVAKVETTLLKGLKNKDVDAQVIHSVARRLNERFDEAMKRLEGQVIERRQNPTGAANPAAAAQEAVDDEQDLREMLDQMREAPEGQAAEVLAADQPAAPGRKKKEFDPVAIELPPEIVDRKSILFFIDKEVARALRYNTKFAVIMLAIQQLRARRKIKGPLSRNAVMNMVLKRLTHVFRDTDIPGMLDDNRLMIVVPMLSGLDARKAQSRILKNIHEEPYELDGIPLRVKLAGITTAFDPDVTPSRRELVARAESEITDMLMRLQHIQSIT
jgi:GGDEF domain-containing protein